jgi:hypothetical protein
MTLESLLNTDLSEWVVEQVIVQDWHDGPRSGICRLRVPAVELVFELLDERQVEDDLDDRLYAIKIASPGAVDSVLKVLDFAGTPPSPVWSPLWRSSDPAQLETASQVIDDVYRQAVATNIVLGSRDFVTFFGRWMVSEANGVVDWFEHLGIKKVG